MFLGEGRASTADGASVSVRDSRRLKRAVLLSAALYASVFGLLLAFPGRWFEATVKDPGAVPEITVFLDAASPASADVRLRPAPSPGPVKTAAQVPAAPTATPESVPLISEAAPSEPPATDPPVPEAAVPDSFAQVPTLPETVEAMPAIETPNENAEPPVQREPTIPLEPAILKELPAPAAAPESSLARIDSPPPPALSDGKSAAGESPSPARYGAPDGTSQSDAYRRLDSAIRKNLKYPAQARKRGMQGTVLLELAVDGEGVLSRCVVAVSSGKSILDSAALRLVKDLFPFPGGLGGPLRTRIAIEYRLD